MNIGAYFHLTRIGQPIGGGKYKIEPTGVGKHTLHMLQGLSALPNVNVKAILPRPDLDASGKIPADFPIASLSVAPLPWSRKSIETSWSFLNWPKLDRWHKGFDWIYCPQEAFVATSETPLAVTVHDVFFFEPDHPWKSRLERTRHQFRWKILYRAIQRHAKLILSVSEFTKSRLVKLLDFDPNRIAVIGNAVDDVYFNEPPPPAENEPPMPESPYLFVVGGLAKKKGGDFLLDVAKELKKTKPDMRIVVTGVSDSPYKELAAEMSNIVRFGYEPVQRQIRLIRGATALMMLSRYEGFGIPALEAMAAGTPAIVSQFASLPEVVGDAGLVVDARQPKSIVQSIEKIHGDLSFRSAIIAKGHHRAAQFRRPVVVTRLYEALQNAKNS